MGAVLDRIGVRRATVVGHSTGGAVATSLAEQRHDLVAGIALIDTGPRIDAFLDAFLDDSAGGRPVTTPVVGELLWRLRTDSTIRGALSSAFTRELRVPDQIIAAIGGMTYYSLTATDQASGAFLEARPIPDRLAGLGLPTLVIAESPRTHRDGRRCGRHTDDRGRRRHADPASPPARRHAARRPGIR